MITLYSPESTGLNKIILQLKDQNNKVFNNQSDFNFENWKYDALSDPLSKLGGTTENAAKKDIVLLAILTALSAIIKNYKVDHTMRYVRTRKHETNRYEHII
jgi:hypothetical protein